MGKKFIEIDYPHRTELGATQQNFDNFLYVVVAGLRMGLGTSTFLTVENFEDNPLQIGRRRSDESREP